MLYWSHRITLIQKCICKQLVDEQKHQKQAYHFLDPESKKLLCNLVSMALQEGSTEIDMCVKCEHLTFELNGFATEKSFTWILEWIWTVEKHHGTPEREDLRRTMVVICEAATKYILHILLLIQNVQHMGIWLACRTCSFNQT